MTLCSTLLSPLLTPLLMKIYGGVEIHFNVVEMFLSIFKVVIIPLVLGVLMIKVFPSLVKGYKKFGASISSLAIAVIIAIVLALNYKVISDGFPIICLSLVMLHNMIGFLLSYFSLYMISKDKKNAFTIAIEVAMQNSGLAVNLARSFFIGLPLATLPGAIFSLWHNISGLSLAMLFSKVNQK